MKIAVVTTNNPNMYSGGRYHSLGIALALSSLEENEVYYVTNNKPIFYDDFKDSNQKVNLFLTDNFRKNMPKGNFDIVILVPHQKDDEFYPNVKLFTLEREARLILVNFESGNWFNEFAQKPLKLWDPWKKACEIGCLMLSISKEGDKYAKDFYTDYPKLTQFNYWYPRINVIEADKSKNIQKEKNRVLILGRITDKHKGSDDLNSLFCKELKGVTFVLLIGSGSVSKEFKFNIEKLADKYEITIEYKYQLSDYEKFVEYKKASVLVFPSFFEGYGYPPVEALYCNTPCIAYDLPVLREVTNNGAIFVPMGDTEALKVKLISFLKETHKYKTDNLQEYVYSYTNFSENSLALDNILKEYLSSELVLSNKRKLVRELKKETKQKSGINYKIKNKLKAIFRLIKPLPDIVQANIKYDNNSIVVKGFILTHKKYEVVSIYFKDKFIGNAQIFLRRPDILKLNPKYESDRCGFEFIIEQKIDEILKYTGCVFDKKEYKIEFK